jgi:hypothetical protein
MIQARTSFVLEPSDDPWAGPPIRRRCSRASQIAIEHVVSRAFAIDPGHRVPHWLGARARTRLRQISMYLQHVACGTTLTAVGSAYGRDRTTAAHACHVVEDLRDHREFDFILEILEMALMALLRR